MRTPKLPKLNVSRRGFFKTAAAGTAAAAALTYISGCSKTTDDSTPEPTVVTEDSATSVTDSYTYQDLGLAATHEWTLALGNVLHPAEGNWIPVTTAGSSASPMVKASALSLESGTLAEVVSEPKGAATTTVIYDVGCSDSVYAWVELDTSTRSWKLYGSSFSGGTLMGETKTLWEGTSDYDPAPFACTGDRVIWQVQPATGGSKTSEHSFCYVWHVGSSAATSVVESPGRFATSPAVSGDNVILTPRVRASEGTYYGVTAYSVSDDLATKVDQLVMPSGVKPFRATRVGSRFLVSVEASYSSGGLLGQMGTYMGTTSGGFVKLNREPSEIGCGNGDTFIIKSRSSYFVVNIGDETYGGISSMDRAVDYGEYPARSGECSQFVTFATVKDASTGYPASVVVRTFQL